MVTRICAHCGKLFVICREPGRKYYVHECYIKGRFGEKEKKLLSCNLHRPLDYGKMHLHTVFRNL